jgi:hypothetical protein
MTIATPAILSSVVPKRSFRGLLSAHLKMTGVSMLHYDATTGSNQSYVLGCSSRLCEITLSIMPKKLALIWSSLANIEIYRH